MGVKQTTNKPKTRHNPPGGRCAALLRLPKRNTSCAAPLKLGACLWRLATSLAAKHGLPARPCRTAPVEYQRPVPSAAVTKKKAAKESWRVGTHAILQLHVAQSHCYRAANTNSFTCSPSSTHHSAKFGRGFSCRPVVCSGIPTADRQIRC